ncbi:response regulator transcription factor [Alkalibacter saccharofermentans]|uniref:Stage 0 sporulation protein A homolog n=1 Tax=Alkalibacter saccharofermentans DSM 14828 TaxID=1120975 RepID=A0A1M4VCD1_9FIRM|nr:response regulator transcription factor [Alkalibacter saccharofermentans]SHE66606.1 DNA-binding response regulator, OmpR family, contains REC and winged-helix (wHTH) domain [Alkalibacter saccharofermentans DSM 14828]
MKILFVEDEKKVTEALQELCKLQNIQCDIANDGEEGLLYALNQIYDVIVLDIMLPGKDGIEILREIRKKGSKTPVLMLTAKDTVEDKVKGLDSGADDYLVKPFSAKELFARIRALGRRIESDYMENVVEIGNFTFDLDNFIATVDGNPLKLSYKEGLLLEMLIKRPDQVFSREQILDRVWGFDAEVNENNIEIYIHNLRKKLKNTNIKIETLRSIGYKLKVMD